MDCVYINLNSATERRRQIESNFTERAPPHWRLKRFEAVDARAVAEMNISGRLRPAEKGCFISHRNVIRACANQTEPVLVLEDDALLGVHTFRIIDQSLRRRSGEDWDLIFTDICVTDLRVMMDFIRMRRKVRTPDNVILLDLAGFPFAGATAYLVNPASARKLNGLLSEEPALNIPVRPLPAKIGPRIPHPRPCLLSLHHHAC